MQIHRSNPSMHGGSSSTDAIDQTSGMQNEMDAHRNIERNIVKEIMRECYPKKIFPNENFVTYFIKLLLLDPNWGITDDFLTSRENVAKFVVHVINELEAKNDPKLITLQLQFYFTCNLELLKNVVKVNREEILERVIRLKQAIFRINEPVQEQIDNITKMMIYYVTLVSGLGNPLLQEVYLEAQAALRSVMSEDEIKEFMGFSEEDKEVHMNQLIKVVSGIRLFNKDCERGGANIQDLPKLLDRAVASIKEEVQMILKHVMNTVNNLTTIVDKCYVLEIRGEREYMMAFKLPNEGEEIDIEYLKDLLIFYRQCELYIRRVIEELQNIETYSNDIFQKFQYTLREVYLVVDAKIAIPASAVYPLFEILSDTWSDLQNQVILLARYSKIIENLVLYKNSVPDHTEHLHGLLEQIGGPLSDAERLEETAELTLESDNPEVEITEADYLPNIDDMLVQCLGFCCWKLVQTNGGLIPGNPGMGIATYRKMNFVFSIPEACTEFCKKPEDLINEWLDLGRKKPHLINFLNIKEHLENITTVSQLAKVKSFATLTLDKKAQVEHEHILPVESSQMYYWNVWDLKRQALQMADLSKRKTVSTQTHKSHFINTVNTQTYEMRNKEVQTKTDNYSNVNQPLSFIYGLRGRKDDKQFIISLTRPL